MESKQTKQKHRLKDDHVPELVPYQQPQTELWHTPIQRPDRRTIAALCTIGLVAMTLGSIAVYRLAFRPSPRGDSGELVSTTPPQVTSSAPYDAETARVVADELEGLLSRYFSAETLEEKLTYVADRERLKPSLKWWWEHHAEGEGAFDLRAFTSRELSGIELVDGRSMLRLTYTLNNGIRWRTYFHDLEGSYLIDWDSLVGHGDLLLSQFVEEKPETETELRVAIVGSDHYNHGFTRDDFVAYRLESADRSCSAYAYASSENPLNLDIHSRPGERSSGVSKKVSVLAKSGSRDGNEPQVVLVRFIRDGWLDPGMGAELDPN